MFSKTIEILKWMSGKHFGFTRKDLQDHFSRDRRSAIRWIREAEDLGLIEWINEPNIPKKWGLVNNAPAFHLLSSPESLALFSKASIALSAAGHNSLSERLNDISMELESRLSSATKIRAATDKEELLLAQGFAVRPGPKNNVAASIYDALFLAFKAPFLVSVVYGGAGETVLEPYGLVYGARVYLLAKGPGDGLQFLRYYRLDRIDSLEVLEQTFVKDPEFDLRHYIARSFGVFQREEEFGPVKWIFSSEVKGRRKAT